MGNIAGEAELFDTVLRFSFFTLANLLSVNCQQVFSLVTVGQTDQIQKEASSCLKIRVFFQQQETERHFKRSCQFLSGATNYSAKRTFGWDIEVNYTITTETQSTQLEIVIIHFRSSKVWIGTLHLSVTCGFLRNRPHQFGWRFQQNRYYFVT